jgi:hypothetical protein
MTEVKPARRNNPKGWVKTDHTNVVINPEPNEVFKYKKTQRLVYDKDSMTFNINQGDALLFNEEGAFVLER